MHILRGTTHEVPAVGFVNEDKLAPTGEVELGRVDLLQAWLEAGLELGNHTWSHPDLHRVDVESFQADVLKGEGVLRESLGEETTPWFRHPFLRTGRDSTLDVAVDAGCPTAPIVGAYLADMREVVLYYEQQSRALFDQEIDQVLLLHANRLNVLDFDELAVWLAGRDHLAPPLGAHGRSPRGVLRGRAGGPGVDRGGIGARPLTLAAEPRGPLGRRHPPPATRARHSTTPPVMVPLRQ